MEDKQNMVSEVGSLLYLGAAATFSCDVNGVKQENGRVCYTHFR